MSKKFLLFIISIFFLLLLADIFIKLREKKQFESLNQQNTDSPINLINGFYESNSDTSVFLYYKNGFYYIGVLKGGDKLFPKMILVNSDLDGGQELFELLLKNRDTKDLYSFFEKYISINNNFEFYHTYTEEIEQGIFVQKVYIYDPKHNDDLRIHNLNKHSLGIMLGILMSIIP